MIIKSDQVIYKMDKDNKPVMRAKSGDRLVFETLDCFSCELTSEDQDFNGIDFDKVNPATGPLYIEGAKPGDVLRVKIEKINVEERGVSVVEPGLGVLGDRITEGKTRIIEVKDGKANFQGLSFLLNTMVGVIGTAPAGEGVNTGTPGDHGGNLDCTQVREGASIYLPVNVEGGLLAMGDIHAAMGDGEVGVAAVEIKGSVEVVVDLIRDFPYQTPFIETEDKYMTLASSKSIEEANKAALSGMADLIMDKTGLSFEDAVMLMSFQVDLATCQVVNPAVTMRAEIKKEVLKK